MCLKSILNIKYNKLFSFFLSLFFNIKFNEWYRIDQFRLQSITETLCSSMDIILSLANTYKEHLYFFLTL